MYTLPVFITDLFPTVSLWLNSSKYILLFIGCIVEGPVLMTVSGFLYRLGAFDFWPMYLVLVLGDFTADIGWYFVGRFGGRPLVNKIGHRFGITESSITRVQGRFHKYHEKILIISKLTMGFGFALVTLIVAGMLHVPFKKYVILNLLGGFVWTGFLLIIGYFFGNVYSMITGPEKIAFVIISAIALVTVLKLANKYLIKANI